MENHTKTCEQCKLSLDLKDFYFRKDFKNNKFRRICNNCYSINNPNNRLCISYLNQKLLKDGLLTCSKCNKTQTVDNFTKEPKNKTGYVRNCLSCRRLYNKNNKIRTRELNLYKKYKISLEDYNTLLTSQNYKCAICEEQNYSAYNVLYVDHCHKTNEVRGLLCSHCNTAIGMFKDNIDYLYSAIDYLNNKLIVNGKEY